MNDLFRFGLILGATWVSAFAGQWMWNRAAARRLDRLLRALGFVPLSSILSDLRRELPFLRGFAFEELRAWRGETDGAETVLLTGRTPAGPVVGYTLLAWRESLWSARCVVRPEDLPGEPRAGEDPDPRRFDALATPALVAALDRERAWFLVEGPWRVVGTPHPISGAAVSVVWRLFERVPGWVEEPEEFSGGLEWNI